MVINMDPETVALLISFWRMTAKQVSPASEKKKEDYIRNFILFALVFLVLVN